MVLEEVEVAFDEITHFQRIGNHRMALNGMTTRKKKFGLGCSATKCGDM